MSPGDRLLCVFVRELPAGEFTQWPLHVTIVPWFRLALADADIMDRLRRQLDGLEPFEVRAGGETAFGYKGQKLVTLVDSPTSLHSIEQAARRLLHGEQAWIVDESTKVRRQFRPHVTAQRTVRLYEGDVFTVSEICLVQQYGGHKAVTGTIQL